MKEVRQTSIIEPLLQQRFELAHVLEAQVQGLKAGDGGLAKVIPVQLSHGQANVSLVVKCKDDTEVMKKFDRIINPVQPNTVHLGYLSKSQFNPPLFKGLGKLL